MAADFSAAITRWVTEQSALLPPMTSDDFSEAAAIFASVPRPNDEAA